MTEKQNNVLKDKEFKEAEQKANEERNKPLKKANGEEVEVREISDGQYIIDKGRVVDEKENFDRDYRGSMIVEEVGEPYYNEEKEDVMRVVRTADGNITGVRQKNIRKFNKKTFGFPGSQRTYDRIFGNKDKEE